MKSFLLNRFMDFELLNGMNGVEGFVFMQVVFIFIFSYLSLCLEAIFCFFCFFTDYSSK